MGVLLTTVQFAKLNNCHKRTVINYIDAGLLPVALKVGKYRMIDSDSKFQVKPVGWQKGRPRKKKDLDL